MDSHKKASPVEAQINRTISQILEVAEGIFSDHPQWDFFRRVILKRLNELKADILN